MIDPHTTTAAPAAPTIGPATPNPAGKQEHRPAGPATKQPDGAWTQSCACGETRRAGCEDAAEQLISWHISAEQATPALAGNSHTVEPLAP